MKNITLLISIGLILSTVNCFSNAGESNLEAINNQAGDGGNKAFVPPKQYCVKLESIETRGGWAGCTTTNTCWGGFNDYEPRNYGRMCTISSENQKLQSDNLSLTDKLSDCQDLWFVADDNPLAATSVVWVAGIVSSLFTGDTTTQLMQMYQGAADPPIIQRNAPHMIDKKFTITLNDYLNNKILLIFLPIIKDDNVTDDILSDPIKMVSEPDAKKHYPVITQISDKDVPTAGEYSIKQTFKRSGRTGEMDFNVKVTRDACP